MYSIQCMYTVYFYVYTVKTLQSLPISTKSGNCVTKDRKGCRVKDCFVCICNYNRTGNIRVSVTIKFHAGGGLGTP